jgi:threonine aldolase
MREAMARAEVGDDVYGEDPTINGLQQFVAELLGKESAIFVPSGTMANQMGIRVHTSPGDEVILEQEAHVFYYETGAPAILSNVQLRTLPGVRGVLTSDQIVEAVRPSEYYLPRTSLVVLENTHNRAGGTIYPQEEIRRIREATRPLGIAMHLDGARLWNASVASGIGLKELAEPFDTISVCFSKGLGAPVGSALVGTRSTIEEALKFRKILGGGMRQAGIIAAGALLAVKNNIERLAEDHENARDLAEGLGECRGLRLDLSTVQTNIVVADLEHPNLSAERFCSALAAQGVLMSPVGPTSLRAVTHLEVSKDDIEKALKVCRTVTGT